jgi:hypothetical protein
VLGEPGFEVVRSPQPPADVGGTAQCIQRLLIAAQLPQNSAQRIEHIGGFRGVLAGEQLVPRQDVANFRLGQVEAP